MIIQTLKNGERGLYLPIYSKVHISCIKKALDLEENCQETNSPTG